MTLQWTTKSRYGDLRFFTYDPEKSEVVMTCTKPLYVSFCPVSNENGSEEDGEVASVDPDGGPYLGVGGKVQAERSGPVFRIHRIRASRNTIKKGDLTVTLSVSVCEPEST